MCVYTNVYLSVPCVLVPKLQVAISHRTWGPNSSPPKFSTTKPSLPPPIFLYPVSNLAIFPESHIGPLSPTKCVIEVDTLHWLPKTKPHQTNKKASEATTKILCVCFSGVQWLWPTLSKRELLRKYIHKFALCHPLTMMTSDCDEDHHDDWWRSSFALVPGLWAWQCWSEL